MIDGTYTGVIDRIVDDETAAILIEDDGEVRDQRDIPVERVPEDAHKEGSVLAVTIEDGEIERLEYRPEETEERRESMQDRLDRLGSRLSEKSGEE